MKQIVNYIILKKRMTFTQFANGLLYFFRSLPLIGKSIPESVFQLHRVKTVLAIIGIVSSIFTAIIGKLIYVFIIICIPVIFILQGKQGAQVGVMIVFFLVSGLLGTMINQTSQPQKKEYFLLRLMHMNARCYVYSTWLMSYGIEAIFLLLSFVISFLVFQIPVWYALIMMIYYEGIHLFAERLHIQYSLTHEKDLSSHYGLIVLMYVIVLPLAYGLVYFIPDLMMLNSAMIVLMLVVGLGSLYVAIPYLTKRVDYTIVMNEGLLRQQKYLVNNLNQAARIKSVELNEKDYTERDFSTSKYANKKGYEYLNAIFFHRHKRLFIRPMVIRILGIIISFIIVDCILFLFRNEILMPDQLLILFSPIMMLLYFLSIGEKVTSSMFYNCDVSLLRYGYYRQPKAILTNFKIRLRKIIKMNLLLSSLLCIGFMSAILLNGKVYSLQDQLLFYACTISGSIFFSVHHLFLYYVLQPYSGELEMKSPMFGIINMVVYGLCYLTMSISVNNVIAILILVATLVYSIVALLTVYKVAYKTFHIR